jgi:hypothetical protein
MRNESSRPILFLCCAKSAPAVVSVPSCHREYTSVTDVLRDRVSPSWLGHTAANVAPSASRAKQSTNFRDSDFHFFWTRKDIDATDGNSLKPDGRRGVQNRAEHARFCSSKKLLSVSALTSRRFAPACQGPSPYGGTRKIFGLPIAPAVFLAVPIPGAIPRPGNVKGKRNEQVTITSRVRCQYAEETWRERFLA